MMSCSSCSSSTTNTCTRCGVANYCNATCQSQNWNSHKDTCKDNQLGTALQRVAEILHEAYLAFRESTFDTPIKRVVNGSQTLTVYDGDQTLNTSFFVAFPEHLIQDIVQIKMELLTAWTGDEPHGFLHLMIERLLQGLNIDVEELTVDLRRPLARSIIVVMPSGQRMSDSDYKHQVLRVTSRRSGNRRWVIDLCGAQYGVAQPFHDGAQYFDRYVLSMADGHNLGHTSVKFANMARQRGLPMLVYRLGRLAAEALVAAMKTWESQNIPLSQLGTLNRDDFDLQKASLLSVLDDAVRTFIATSDFTAVVQRVRRGF